MVKLEWKMSEPLTVGVEWELQILDRESLEPKDIFDQIADSFPKVYLPMLHREIYQSMLEIVTPPLREVKKLGELLKEIFETLSTIAVKQKFHLVGLGSLFLPTKKETKINVNERYKRFAEEFQELLRDFYIYGIHIHIGLPSKEWALRTYNNLIKYAPLLLSLSANSIFYKGKNTGIHSYRTVIFEKLPRAELPRQFNSYDEFKKVIKHLYSAGVIESLKDLWWHIRLRPDFGTVEIRVFDSLWDLNRLLTLVKLIKALALYSEKYQDEPLPVEYLKQNWWWAKRYSLDADFVDLQGRKALKQVAYDLLYKLEHLGIFKKLGYQIKEFTNLLRKPYLAKDIVLKSHALGLKKVVKLSAVV